MSGQLMPRVTIADVRQRLSIYRNEIKLDGNVIGHLVRYGGGRSMGNVGLKTVYASRIYGNGVKIEEEGSKERTVLDKVATALARAIKAGKWTQ